MELQVIEAPHGSYIEVQARMILLLLLLLLYIYVCYTNKVPPQVISWVINPMDYSSI